MIQGSFFYCKQLTEKYFTLRWFNRETGNVFSLYAINGHFAGMYGKGYNITVVELFLFYFPLAVDAIIGIITGPMSFYTNIKV